MRPSTEGHAVEGFPLSPPQQHAWRLGRHSPFAWNVGLRVALRGPLEQAALEQALVTLVAAEEILRTGFTRLSGSSAVVQVIAQEPGFELDRHDLGGASGEERERAAGELFDALVARPFELEHEPSRGHLRVAWLRFDERTHELVLVQPALCADAASLWILARRLVTLLDGRPPAPAEGEEAMQYADLAQWMREMFEAEEAPEGLGFWRRVEPSALAPARLSFERAERGAAFQPACVPLAADLPGLRALAQRTGAAPQALLLAAWHRLLALHTEHAGAALGVCSAGRTYEGLDGAPGPFQRTLPIVLQPVLGETLAACAARAASALEQAAEWHELFELERLHPSGDATFLAHAFEHHPTGDAIAGPFALHALERRSFADRFRLKLVWDEGAARELTLWYDGALFPQEAAEVLAGQLATLLADALAHPERALTELALVSPAERERLHAFARGAPAAELEGARLVHWHILAHARATPAATAVVSAAERLSYAELVARAERLARHLAELGVRPGDHVGLALGRSCEWTVGMLAVLLAGAAYLPLPPGYPPERLEFMLTDTRTRVVLTRRADAARLSAALLAPSGARLVVLDELALAPAPAPFVSPAEPADSAYVIYTSGSTGRPKGVPIPHANLARSTAARLVHYRRQPGVYLLLSSFAFDSSVAGVFWTLCAGGTLVLPEEGDETDLVALAGWIEREGVTHTLTLPSLWSVLLEETAPERLRSLASVVVAGEACAKELVARHFARLPGCELHNEYGPTEGTVWCTVHDCATPSERPSVPIGRPIPGAQVWVVDARGALAPLGVPGELWLGGAGVAPGYLGRPELTAERFVPDRFGARAGARLYRSGDLVRWQHDGTLEFLGRVDHQVKIRGQRVELGEIEAVLAAEAGLQEVLVHAREARPGEKELVAYVVRRPSAAQASAQELRTRLAATLPEAMVPAHFVFLEELPRLPNGKVDRGQLPDPLETGEARAPYRAPHTPLETVLAELWAEVLDRERIGLDDDFFLLGGHSILATQLFARITDALDVRIPLRALFEARTVRALAEAILREPSTRARIERTAELLVEVLSGEEDPSA